MLLGRRLIAPGDTRRYFIDYSSFLATAEVLSSFVFAVDTGPATVPSSSIASDGKGVTIVVTGASLTYPLFNIAIAATTSLSQVKNDHVELDVAAP